jgi:hypothetical protein
LHGAKCAALLDRIHCGWLSAAPTFLNSSLIQVFPGLISEALGGFLGPLLERANVGVRMLEQVARDTFDRFFEVAPVRLRDGTYRIEGALHFSLELGIVHVHGGDNAPVCGRTQLG